MSGVGVSCVVCCVLVLVLCVGVAREREKRLDSGGARERGQ